MNRPTFPLLLALLLAVPVQGLADMWIDDSRHASVTFDRDEGLIVLSQYDEYYSFDEVYESLESGKDINLRLELPGANGPAQSLFGDLAIPFLLPSESPRSIAFRVPLDAIPPLGILEDLLVGGQEMRLTVDDGKVFAGYRLHRSNELSEDTRDRYAR